MAFDGSSGHSEGHRRPSTSSYASSSNSHKASNMTSAPGTGSTAAAAAGDAAGRPYTAGSEASSIRSTNSNPYSSNTPGYGASTTNSNGFGAVQEERSSPVASYGSRVPKIVPMASRPGSAEDLSNFEYELVVRQQPKQARLCSGNDKLPKGPVDPPPVVRLQISRSSVEEQVQPKPPMTARSDTSSTYSDEDAATQRRSAQNSKLTSASLIQSPYLFCFAALCKAEEDEELYLLPDGKTRYVTGNVVSSLYHLKDPRDGSAEGFFVFPDIGVRVEGTFRLKLSLYEMVDATVHHCKTVYTEPFQVYSPKQFPGIQDATELSKSFATQGLKMRIKGGPARTGGKPIEASSRTSDASRPGSSNSSNLAKRPHTGTDNMYNYADESNKRRALEGAVYPVPQRDAHGSFRYQPQHQHGALERGPHAPAEGDFYQSRPTSSSSYTSTRPESEGQPYPSSIDARARFRDQQQYYPGHTAAPPADRLQGLGLYPPAASRQRPTTAPTMPSAHTLSVSDPYLQSPSRQRYPYPPHNAMAGPSQRPMSSSGDHMPPPRSFGPPIASRYQLSQVPEHYTSYNGSGGPGAHHNRHMNAPTDAYLPRIQPVAETQRPSSSSGAQRISLPSLSEMIRRPDLDLPTIPASTSSLRTLLNPEARNPNADLSAVPRQGPGHLPESRGTSPLANEEVENPSEEDRRYFEIRARQMQHRRSSMTEH